MIELHLIGYTADLGHLVLDLAGTNGGRYRMVVDEDLFATLDELREERRAAGLPVGDLVEFADELGLSVSVLEQFEEQEGEAAAARGHVSAGSVRAQSVIEAGRLDADEVEAATDEPIAGFDVEPVDDVEFPDAEDTDAAAFQDVAGAEEAADAGDHADDAGEVWEVDTEAVLGGPEDDLDPEGFVDQVMGDTGDETARDLFEQPLADATIADDEDLEPDPGYAPVDDDSVAADWDLDEGADADGASIGPEAPAGGRFRVPQGRRPGGSRPATRVPQASTVRVVAAPPPPPDEPEPGLDNDTGLVARLLDERDSHASDELDRDLDVPWDTAVEPAAGEMPATSDELAAERVEPPPPPPPAVVDRTWREPEPEPDPPPPPVSHRPPPEPIAVRSRRDGTSRTPPRALVPELAATQPEPPPARRPSPPPEPVDARLSPAQIQARLRSGKSVRSVATEAGVDAAWIERWQGPVLAEKARVLAGAQALRLERARLGRSSHSLGDAVRRNLRAKSVAEDDITWDASRRRDGRWRVGVKYVSRGRKRSATWLYDPDDGVITAASDNAREIGFTRRQR